jgi:hypothetical protein
VEKLRPTVPTPQEIELSGIATYPELIQFATRTPGRAIDDNITTIVIRNSYHFYGLKNLGNELQEDKLAKYHINGGSLNDSPTNIFSPDISRRSIQVPPEERAFDENTGRIIKKDRSIGTMVQFSLKGSYPTPRNLAHLLLEDSNYDAATAAFFLTNNDYLYGIFRTKNTPQMKKEEMQEAISHLLAKKQSLADEGMDIHEANLFVLERAREDYSLKLFNGKLNRLRLYERFTEI